jgi:sugar lactone lactonase YvrE
MRSFNQAEIMNLRFLITLTVLLLFRTANAQIYNNWVLQKVDSNFLFTEGPCWNPAGKLLFSDISGNTIYQWDHVNTSVPLITSSGGTNGIARDVYGNLYLAQQGSRKVSKVDTLGNITTLAVLYNGDSLNSPNDIVVRSSGYIYFTDPTYGITPAEQELNFCGVWCIKVPGDTLKLLVDTLAKPNGLAFSPDEQRLYVCNSYNSKIYYYDMKPDGTLKPGRLFARVNSEIDGIKTDLDGNVYVAAALKGVKMYSPAGILIDSIAVPEKVTNLAWGDKYRNTLYITAGGSLYSFHRNANYPFVCTELLGRPTGSSITLNMVPEENIDAYIEYGTASGNYSGQTSMVSVSETTPLVITITGLNANTKYYYRIRYRRSGSSTFLSRAEHSFMTQRSTGSSFVFDVHADPHLDPGSNYSTYLNTLSNTVNDHPDFFFDLGDNFMSEKLARINFQNIEERNLLLRHFYDKAAADIPLFLVCGNHEGELGWLNTGNPASMPVWAAQIRKLYYPNPEPNSFYTGDTAIQDYIGLRESYYAWTWGDALFVVIDPYWYTTVKPAASLNNWDWTLGEDQYRWFKETLETSNAKYKFVMAHQIVGGDSLGQGRGGVEYVPYYEMGGLNADSSSGLFANRPGWNKSIHQLMVDNCVNIFFHGHDHFYGKQILDGVIYQEVPQPSLQNYTQESSTEYGYTQGLILPNSGHLRVTVCDSNAKVEYVRSYHINNPANGWIIGQVSDTYTVLPCTGTVGRPENKAFDCNVFPNPARDHLFIRTSAGVLITEIRLINMMGKLKALTYENSLDISQYPAGIYFLRIRTVQGECIRKIVIE